MVVRTRPNLLLREALVLASGVSLQANDAAVLGYVNGQAFSFATLDLAVDGFGEAVRHVAKSTLDKSGVYARVLVVLHV